MALVVNYAPPWWVNLLHRVPRFSFDLEKTSNDFQPENRTYQQSILLLVGLVLTCLALDLLFLLFYSIWLCCQRNKEVEQRRGADCCCSAWCVIVATLVCSAGIAVGFYGNGETCDGVYRMSYSLRNANHTMTGVQKLVNEGLFSLNQTVETDLQQLKVQYAGQADYMSIIQKLEDQLGQLVLQMVEIPFWKNADVSLEALAIEIEFYDWYRWLGYIILLSFDILICFLVLFGLIRNSKGILAGVCLFGVLALIMSWISLGMEFAVSASSSDLCVAPDTYITKVVNRYGLIDENILQYYLSCHLDQANPFQEILSGSHKALVGMQDNVSAWLRSLAKEHEDSRSRLVEIQDVLNQSEIRLHQLTALVDCRSLHMDYVQAMTGLCYDTLEGVIYLLFFSFITALLFSSIVCSVPHTWRAKRTEDNTDFESLSRRPYRAHMPSLYSSGSSYGSEMSIRVTAHTVSNAPVTEYMAQNSRCEDVPLIEQESPPPSYTLSMRAKYLANTRTNPSAQP